MRTTSPISDRRSFTIVEILVVIVIITILMAFLVPAVAGLRARARRRATAQRMELIAVAIEAFKADYGVYPPDSIEAALELLDCGRPATTPDGYYSDALGEDNEGIKALWIALTCPKKNGPHIEEDRLGRRALPVAHVYYTARPSIREGVGGLGAICNTTAQGDDIQIIADGVSADLGQTLIAPGPDGVLDTATVSGLGDTDYVHRGDPHPVAVFIDLWGNDLRYDRTNTFLDNAGPVIVESENGDRLCNTTADGDDVQIVPPAQPARAWQVLVAPGLDGVLNTAAVSDDVEAVRQPHMLRNAASYDLWSAGADAMDDCLDTAGATDRAWDADPALADDGDDVTNWKLSIYQQ